MLTWRCLGGWPGGMRWAHTNFFRSLLDYLTLLMLSFLNTASTHKGAAVFNRFAHSAGPSLVRRLELSGLQFDLIFEEKMGCLVGHRIRGPW